MQYRRMVVKIGTSTLTQGTRAIQYPRIVELARQIRAIQDEKCQVVLVSSGAITAGKEALGYSSLVKQIDPAGSRAGERCPHGPWDSGWR